MSKKDPEEDTVMKFVLPNPEELHVGLRALMTLAVIDEALHDSERQVLDAAQRMLGGSYELDELSQISPTELADALPRPGVRSQLFGGLIVMCMADGEVNHAEAALMAAFAEALGVPDSTARNLKRIAEGHYLRARMDILRRQWAPKKIREMAEQDGNVVYFRAVLGGMGVKSFPEITDKYRAFGRYPAGSLGRAYFDYMNDNAFSFPGSKGAPPEAMLFHDFSHILSGYGTHPAGEIQVAAFSAGYSTYEVHNWFMFVLSQFQIGLQTAPNVPPATMQLDPEDMMIAFRRGAAMNIDVNDGWDFWPLLEQPLDELRVRYNVLPLDAFRREAR